MKVDCSPAVLRALGTAAQIQGGVDPVRALLACLLHETEGAASESASQAGLVSGLWDHRLVLPTDIDFSGLKIRELTGEIQSIVRRAGILFRESFQEGEVTSPYLLLAALQCRPDLVEELVGLGLVMDRLEKSLLPISEKTILVPGVDLENPVHETRVLEGSAIKMARVRLYFLVTAKACALGLERTVKEALAGGVGAIQSREKELADKAWLGVLESLRSWTEASGALLIVNDRPDLAVISGADGVHLGQDDMEIRQARGILGQGKLVGASTHTPDEWRQAVRGGADYAGVGPVFASRTKEFTDFAGLEYVRRIAMTNEIPWFALGGIGQKNIEQVAEAGARRVAVSSCLAMSADPRGEAMQMVSCLEP